MDKIKDLKSQREYLKEEKEWFAYFNLPSDEYKREVKEYHKQKKSVNNELAKYNKITLTKIQKNKVEVDSNPDDLTLYLNQ